jgi:lipoyl synthase
MGTEPDNTGGEFMRKPGWLKRRLPAADDYSFLKERLNKFSLHTICESGSCPNISECWSCKTATFMLLGDVCSRNCRFCGVAHGAPPTADIDESRRIALAVQELGIRHCVLTSVTRDDLADGGAAVWAEAIRLIRELNPETTIETLIPDFQGDADALQSVISMRPEVISHNLETVRRLTPTIRSGAQYERSLQVLRQIAAAGVRAKSGLMAGLGESDAEIHQSMDDLIGAGCQVITIGQYLRPSKGQIPVHRYVPPEQFAEYKVAALQKGFLFAECQPFVRSSYHAWMHVGQATASKTEGFNR